MSRGKNVTGSFAATTCRPRDAACLAGTQQRPGAGPPHCHCTCDTAHSTYPFTVAPMHVQRRNMDTP
eukprot:2057020-Prorocentrum_lima.AAC.1